MPRESGSSASIKIGLKYKSGLKNFALIWVTHTTAEQSVLLKLMQVLMGKTAL